MHPLKVHSVANIFVPDPEETLIFDHAVNPFRTNIIYFWRYIDDIFLLFQDRSKVEQFIQWINQTHGSIKFTVQFDVDVINFLDVTVFRRDGNRLAVRPFTKSTDKNTYLHFNILPSPPFRKEHSF